MTASRRRWLSGVVTAVVAIGGAAYWIDVQGRLFFDHGKELVDLLDPLARALTEKRLDDAAEFYADEFVGDHGLTWLEPMGERGGIRELRFRPRLEGETQRAPIDEWRAYLDGFREISEIRLHVHRLERWRGTALRTATVRFEAIGTPTGESRPAIDRATIRMRFEARADRWVIARASLVADDPALPAQRLIAEEPQFEEVGETAGVAFENRYYPGFFDRELRFAMLRYGPAGITAADYDGDGLADLFIPDGVASRLLRNDGRGGFEDVTREAGLEGLSGVSVALFADWDEDGVRDLFVSRTFEPNQIFRGRGDGTFEDVTARSGLSPDCCTTVASAADYDLDGDLDLYVGRYLDPRVDIPTTFYARNGEPNRLYANDGDGTFTDVTEAAGVGEVGLCLGTVFGDFDDDGDPDLYVANDFGRKTLYENRGDGTFEDITVASGTLAYGAGMSASFADYDNDGLFDFYVAHIRSEHAWFAEAPTVGLYMLNSLRQGTWTSDMPLYWEIFRQSGTDFVGVFQQMASGNTLLRNRGDGTFEDATLAAGANPPGWFWGTVFADFDNDGWQDLYAANGWVQGEPGTEIELEFLRDVVQDQRLYKSGRLFDPDHFGGRSWHGWERNRHLRNNGDGTFTEIATPAGTDLLLNSRGVAVADFWNRGVLDIAVAASTDRHALLANRIGPGRHWLQVELEGAGRRLPDGTNREAVGARVILEAGGLTQSREVVLGDSYGSQSPSRLHFGLGDHAGVEVLRVRWPRSGREQVFHDLDADRLIEGRGRPRRARSALRDKGHTDRGGPLSASHLTAVARSRTGSPNRRQANR